MACATPLILTYAPRLEVVLHGERECPAARFELRRAVRAQVLVGGRNASDLCLAERAISSTDIRLVLAGQERTLVSSTSSSRSTDGEVVVVCELQLLIADARQSELPQRVIQEVDSRNAELQFLPLRDLEILEQCQIAVKVSRPPHVRPFQRALLPVRRHSEALVIKGLTGLQMLRRVTEQRWHEEVIRA